MSTDSASNQKDPLKETARILAEVGQMTRSMAAIVLYIGLVFMPVYFYVYADLGLLPLTIAKTNLEIYGAARLEAEVLLEALKARTKLLEDLPVDAQIAEVEFLRTLHRRQWPISATDGTIAKFMHIFVFKPAEILVCSGGWWSAKTYKECADQFRLESILDLCPKSTNETMIY